MAILDFLTEAAPSQVFDYVVVGAGAAGIFLADGLSKAGSNVCLLETGGWSEDDEYQSLNDLEQTGKKQGNSLWNRKRNFLSTPQETHRKSNGPRNSWLLFHRRS